MIDLAPNHKIGLTLRNPVMIAAGCYGWGAEYRSLVDLEPLGAVVVGPVTARPRRGSEPPRLMPFPGGVLLGTGLANPGVSRVIREARRFWSQSPVPVVVHVAATSPHAVSSSCSRIAEVEEVAAVEIGLGETSCGDRVSELVSAAVDAAAQPLIVRVPLDRAIDLAQQIEDTGADALTVACPPPGTLYHAASRRFISGWVYGPAVLPLVLDRVVSVRELVSMPIIGSGGVWEAEDARTLLRAGCVAVQIDAAVWRDPGLPSRIARALAE
jgi:dihydroorotate dehydrogenase (NAD+) catalytic subunit